MASSIRACNINGARTIWSVHVHESAFYGVLTAKGILISVGVTF